MAITTSSGTPIEILLKSALQREGLDFKEQFRIYEKASDLHPKFVVDFLVFSADNSVIVECDGFSHHSTDADVDRDIQRDLWLKHRGYKKILRFTAFQLNHEMDTAILCIKHSLGLISVPKKKLRFRGKPPDRKPILNKPNSTLHKVILYYSCVQAKDTVWIVYKFHDATLNRFSEERIKIFYNVPNQLKNELALYVALLDLKRSVNLTVYCPSEWLTAYFNAPKPTTSSSSSENLLIPISVLLKEHNYLFKYLSPFLPSTNYRPPSASQLILCELQRRCGQIRRKKSAHHNGKSIDFSTFIGLHD